MMMSGTNSADIIISLSDQIQVEAKSIFVFWGCWSCHSDFPGYERDVTRISLRIALQTLDLQNSCSELAAIWASRLAALQPANTTASQQIRHTHAHVLISLECLHTTPIKLIFIFNYYYFFKYVKQRCEPSSKRRPPLPSADRPLLRLPGRSLSVDADMQPMNM